MDLVRDKNSRVVGEKAQDAGKQSLDSQIVCRVGADMQQREDQM